MLLTSYKAVCPGHATAVVAHNSAGAELAAGTRVGHEAGVWVARIQGRVVAAPRQKVAKAGGPKLWIG